jgi:Tfp pilus assembly protein PilO
MKLKNRQQLLMIVAIGVVGYLVADKVIFSPLGAFWTSRSKQIAQLSKKVADGNQLLRREPNLRAHWQQMRTNALPTNPALAEQQVIGAFDRWSRNSGLSLTSISPQWKHDSDEYTTLQCRVEASGNISTLSRFLYDIEKDPMALKLEIVELSARDNEGRTLALGLQVSGLVLNSQEKRP